MKRLLCFLIMILFFIYAGNLFAEETRVISANKITEKDKLPVAEEKSTLLKEKLNLENHIFINGVYNSESGASIGVGYYFHKYFGAGIDFGISISNKKDVFQDYGIIEQNSYRFLPSIKLFVPVHYSRWSTLVLSAYSGLIIDKPVKQDMGLGNRSGIDINIQVFPLKELSAAVGFGSGIGYYSYKSASRGSGFESDFNIAFYYYF